MRAIAAHDALRGTTSSNASDSPLSPSGPAQPFDTNDYIFVCELRPLHKPRLSAQSTLLRQELMNSIRTKLDTQRAQSSLPHPAQNASSSSSAASGRELFLGETIALASTHSQVELSLTFNAQHHSWDYSWRSNRWSATNEQHVVDVVVLRYSPLSVHELVVTASYASAPFYIISSHKKAVPRMASSDMEVLCASQLLRELADHDRSQREREKAVAADEDSGSDASEEKERERERERQRNNAQGARVRDKPREQDKEREPLTSTESAASLSLSHSLPVSVRDARDREREREREKERERASIAEGAETLMSLLSRAPQSLSLTKSLDAPVAPPLRERERERLGERSPAKRRRHTETERERAGGVEDAPREREGERERAAPAVFRPMTQSAAPPPAPTAGFSVSSLDQLLRPPCDRERHHDTERERREAAAAAARAAMQYGSASQLVFLPSRNY